MTDMMQAPQGDQPQPPAAPEKTVCIEVDAQGQYTVGLEPQGMEGQESEDQEKSYMSPVKSLDDALRVAKDLLTSDQAQSAENDQAFQGGFNKALGT